MRLLTLLLALTAISFASSTLSGEVIGVANYTLPATDDIFESYAYNAAEQMTNVGASFGDYAAVDDYNGSIVDITMYTAWGITTGSLPTTLEIMVVADDAGVPSASGPTSQTSYPVTCEDSGFTYGGYTIWVAVVDLSENPILVLASCWIGTHRADFVAWYPIGGTTVTGSEGHRTVAAGWAWEPFSANLVEAGDLFKIIEGYGLSLERTTWAGIKTAF